MATDGQQANAAILSQKETERLAYSITESAELLGVHYFSVYRLIHRGKLRTYRGPYGKWFVTRSELLRLLQSE